MTEYILTEDAYKTLTELETKVMVYSLQTSLVEFCVSVEDISEGLHMNVKSVKGVVGSLVKKGLIDAQREVRGGEIFFDLYVHAPSGWQVNYGYENLEEDIIEEIEDWIRKNK